MKNATIVIAFFVLLLGVLFWYVGQDTEVSDVLTYVNATYGISFEYPDTYALQEREVGDAHRYHYSITLIDKEALANIPQNSEGPPTINVDIFQNNLLDAVTVAEWVYGTNFSNFKLSPDSAIFSTTVAGEPALTYSWEGLYHGESIVLAHRGNIVMLSVTSLTLEDRIRSDFSRFLSSISLY